jgi:hypothetical protein
MDNFNDSQKDDTLRHSPETNETNDELATFYDEDPLLPNFKPLDKGIRSKDAVELLLLPTLSETQLARNIPIDIAITILCKELQDPFLYFLRTTFNCSPFLELQHTFKFSSIYILLVPVCSHLPIPSHRAFFQ